METRNSMDCLSAISKWIYLNFIQENGVILNFWKLIYWYLLHKLFLGKKNSIQIRDKKMILLINYKTLAGNEKKKHANLCPGGIALCCFYILKYTSLDYTRCIPKLKDDNFSAAISCWCYLTLPIQTIYWQREKNIFLPTVQLDCQTVCITNPL